ncbi:MAG: ankyrin repeat domain-containing protein [Bacteroides sp.]|nr:ankyrin repeat domain-containing protein [Prevotella sp.]MCM1407012.1 ankyrin repeat domain-containing protein [Treponema brennaborense]MCM1470163.1 ankyrin repeat domain-containing protein [Bacteroides sp.]
MGGKIIAEIAILCIVLRCFIWEMPQYNYDLWKKIFCAIAILCLIIGLFSASNLFFSIAFHATVFYLFVFLCSVTNAFFPFFLIGIAKLVSTVCFLNSNFNYSNIINAILVLTMLATLVLEKRNLAKKEKEAEEKTIRNNDLLDAINRRDKETARRLIADDVDVNYVGFVNCRNKTILQVAVEIGDKDIVSLLIDKGADVNQEADGKRALDYAKEDEIISILRGHGAKTKAESEEQDKADIDFVYAIGCHDVERVKSLISQISNIDTIPSNINKPNMPKHVFDLELVSYNQYSDELKKYIDGNITPLLFASYNDDIEMVKLLVENGANVNSQSSYGLTALMFASIYYKQQREHTIELIDFLISKGADMNKKSYDVEGLVAKTALMLAISAGNIDAILALIKNGADVNVKASNGATALSIARGKEFTEIENLLIQSGAYN